MTLQLILTRAGAAEIEAAYRNKRVVTLKEVAIGDGGGQPVTVDEGVTALAGEFGREPFSAGGTTPGLLDGTVVIPAARYARKVIRELGLISEAGTLVAYACYPDTFLPAQSDTIVKEVIVDFIMPLVHATSVVLQVDPDRALMTRELADKRYLRTDLNLLEILLRGQNAQQDAREALDVVDGTLVKKGLVQLTSLTRKDDEDSEALAITPRALKKVADALAPLTVPVGGAMLWFHPVPPDGWLEGNGQAFDPVRYPKLHAVYPAGRVPDCRGYFLRGWDNGAGVDPDGGRALASVQQDAMQNITGSFPADTREAGAAGAATSGAFTESRISKGSGSDGANRGRLFRFDASRVVRTAAETRGKNIACMVIFKTDKVEAEEGEPAPTAVIVTPGASAVNAGSTQQFTATIVPASVSGQYPVTWSVSDPTLGSISATGRYTAFAGKTGQQTAIASLSTGLSGTAGVTQCIYATSLTLAPVPDIEAGETIDAVIQRLPATADEPLLYSSASPDVATFFNGQVTGLSAGTAVITVTGKFSGVSGSQTVTVTQPWEGVSTEPGGVGAYAFMKFFDPAMNRASPGEIFSGADLRFAGTIVSFSNPVPSGTWMCCGAIANNNERTLFQRII
ncbi:phage tail protein [Enterobacter roggenkampii]|uniref:phage tail-collar fiber domain-containing protein n=1 Tax=Enterobacter roggenkampii TaxID=1812935 RepID=UPI002237E7BB|nr:phage tail protein [Enterobacter roggenkampii]MCW5003538.1 phage tail protein [Enterobacter roggenkampii]